VVAVVTGGAAYRANSNRALARSAINNHACMRGSVVRGEMLVISDRSNESS